MRRSLTFTLESPSDDFKGVKITWSWNPPADEHENTTRLAVCGGVIIDALEEKLGMLLDVKGKLSPKRSQEVV